MAILLPRHRLSTSTAARCQSLDNIANTRRIAAVVRGGRVLLRRELDGMLADAERTASLKSISEVLFRTFETKGIAAAAAQYRELRVREHDVYDSTTSATACCGPRE